MQPDALAAATYGRDRSAGALSVVIADDDVLLRAGLASLLDRSGLTVLGQAGDGAGVLSLVRAHQPDLVVLDVQMPPTHSTEGLDAAKVIRQESPHIAIVALWAQAEAEHAMELGGQPARRLNAGLLLTLRLIAVPLVG